MSEKVAFETHANVNFVEQWVGDKMLRLEKGKPYETSDSGVISLLDDTQGIKRIEKAKKAEGDKSANG